MEILTPIPVVHMDPMRKSKFMVEHMVGHTMPNKWMIDGYSGYGLGLTLVWDVGTKNIPSSLSPSIPKIWNKRSQQ